MSLIHALAILEYFRLDDIDRERSGVLLTDRSQAANDLHTMARSVVDAFARENYPVIWS